MGEESIGAYRSVNLGSDDTLREESSVHAHLVGHPLVVVAVGVDRREQGNICAAQVLDHVISHASVGHVDHSGSRNRVGMAIRYQHLDRVDRIDHVARLLKGVDQTVGHTHLAGEDNAGCVITPFPLLAEPCLIFSHGREILVVILRRIIEQRRGRQHRVARSGGEELLAVDELADIAEHVAVIAASAGKILLEIGHVDRVDRHDVVLRICDRRREHRGAALCSLDEFLTLFVGHSETHSVEENHVVFSGLVEILDRKFVNHNRGVIIGAGNLSERDSLIVDKRDSCP